MLRGEEGTSTHTRVIILPRACPPACVWRRRVRKRSGDGPHCWILSSFTSTTPTTLLTLCTPLTTTHTTTATTYFYRRTTTTNSTHTKTITPRYALTTATTREGGGGERGGEADQDGPGREDSDLQPEEGVRSDLNEVAKGERREGE